MSEESFIERLTGIFDTPREVVRGAGDDCAVIEIPGCEKYLLAAVDQVVRGVHFLPQEPPSRYAAKLVRRNVSDIAAMGGLPSYAMLSIAASPLDEDPLYEFHQGIRRECGIWNMSVVGGDISKLPEPGGVFSLSIFGFVEKDRVRYRNGARPGDILYATGCFGRSFETEHHLTFQPRLGEGRFLGGMPGVRAMMDVSDGLLKDSLRMAAASGCALELETANILARDSASLTEALCDGEDYELIFAVSPGCAAGLEHQWPFSEPVSPIGIFREGAPGEWLNSFKINKTGFDHFS